MKVNSYKLNHQPEVKS